MEAARSQEHTGVFSRCGLHFLLFATVVPLDNGVQMETPSAALSSPTVAVMLF